MVAVKVTKGDARGGQGREAGGNYHGRLRHDASVLPRHVKHVARLDRLGQVLACHSQPRAPAECHDVAVR